MKKTSEEIVISEIQKELWMMREERACQTFKKSKDWKPSYKKESMKQDKTIRAIQLCRGNQS